MIDATIHSVETLDEANEFMRWLGERRDVLAVDTETGGLEWWQVDLRLVQFGDATTAWVIRWDLWAGLVVEALRKYDGQLVMHNAKFDTHMLRHHGRIQLAPWHRVDDTRLMAHVLKSTQATGLKSLAKRLVDPRADAAQDVLDTAMAKQGWSWATIPLDFPAYWAYAGLDAIYTARLWPLLREQIVSENLWGVYLLDLCVSELLGRMETHGSRIDRAYCAQTYAEYVDWTRTTEQWVLNTYGVRPSSNKKLAERLQQEGIPLTKLTSGGALSVDADVLSSIDHPLAQTALRVRQLTKIASTYLRNFMELADGRDFVHPSINPLGARTGRMSMASPNLQNLPRHDSGRPEAIAARNCFVPTDDDHVLVMADFDQIEQRMMAHYAYTVAGDPGMLQAFAEGDIFTEMARRIADDDTIMKTDPRRQMTKNAAYAKAYGAGAEKFSLTAGVDVGVGAAFLERYDQMYPGVRGFQRYVEQVAIERQRSTGEAYVVAPIGRRHFAERGKLYTLVNYLIQGTAADILKQKMIALDAAGLGPYMVLPVHDEIICDVPREYLKDVVHTLRAVMPETELFTVPLTVGVDAVERWGHKYTGQLIDLEAL